jgi:hypothetical protein
MKLGIMTRRKQIRNDAGTPVIAFGEDRNSQDQGTKIENENERNQRRNQGSPRYVPGKEIEQSFLTHLLGNWSTIGLLGSGTAQTESKRI